MKITDAFDGIYECYPDGSFDLKCWERYAEKISPSFADKIKNDAADYNFEQDILPVLQAAYDGRDRLAEAHNSFCRLTDGLSEKVRDKLGGGLNVHIVFYLGLCSGAGWATDIDGVPAVLLGTEKIAELSWTDEKSMAGLIYHELGHLWHFQTRTVQTEPKSPKEKALWQLYTEGMAMHAEQLLCGDESFYHQDRDGWLRWCTENRGRLFGEFLKRIENGESVHCFFGDWNNFEGRSDVGYYLGGELIRSLSERCPLKELANLKLPEIEKALKAQAEC